MTLESSGYVCLKRSCDERYYLNDTMKMTEIFRCYIKRLWKEIHYKY